MDPPRADAWQRAGAAFRDLFGAVRDLESWRQLGVSPDQETYLQLGSLLEHLGLSAALAELVQRSQASDDPDIREVPDFFPTQRQDGS